MPMRVPILALESALVFELILIVEKPLIIIVHSVREAIAARFVFASGTIVLIIKLKACFDDL